MEQMVNSSSSDDIENKTNKDDEIEETEEDRKRYEEESKKYFAKNIDFLCKLENLQDVLDLSLSKLQQYLNSKNDNIGELRYDLLNYINTNTQIRLKLCYKNDKIFYFIEYDPVVLKEILKDTTNELDLLFRYKNLEEKLNPKLFYSKRLHKMIYNGRLNIETGEQLVNLGADIHYNDDVMIKIAHDNPHIYKFLLQHGANPSIDNELCLRILASLYCLSELDDDNKNAIECANMLVEFGASIPNAILYSRQKDNKETVERLEDFLKSFPLSDVKVAK